MAWKIEPFRSAEQPNVNLFQRKFVSRHQETPADQYLRSCILVRQVGLREKMGGVLTLDIKKYSGPRWIRICFCQLIPSNCANLFFKLCRSFPYFCIINTMGFYGRTHISPIFPPIGFLNRKRGRENMASCLASITPMDGPAWLVQILCSVEPVMLWHGWIILLNKDKHRNWFRVT